MSRIDILNQFGLKPKYALEKEKLEAVKQDGYFIQYIQNPSEALQLEAVKQNGYAIKYIDNPSEINILNQFGKLLTICLA